MKRLLSLILPTFIAFFLLISNPGAVYAASHTSAPLSSANGYRLSPVRTDLTVSKGSSEQVSVIIQNISAAPENLAVLVDDFEAPTNETGYPTLLLNGATAPTHSLKQFVEVPNTSVNLQPGQQQTVTVVIKVPTDAESGGYYGAIRFAPVTFSPSGAKNVNLAASVASLVLLTVPGNLVEQLSIIGFGVSQGNSVNTHNIFFNNKNLYAQIRFSNTGNIQVQPIGNVFLKNGSKVLGTFAVNSSSLPGNVLPQSIRRFTVSINKVNWYGKYKIIGSFNYGSKGQVLNATSTFYVIPVLFIVIAILIILLILFLIFGLPRIIKSYNRRVIAKANHRLH